MSKPAHYLHKDFPKTKDETDFWGQVSRTINGEAVSDEQIEMIVDAVKTNLCLTGTDQLLDLGCGNGALASYFFADIDKYHGVDFSSYLIEIANKYFKQPEKSSFTNLDIVSFLKCVQSPERFSKCLCYGVFSYLSHSEANEALEILFHRFENLNRVFIGNLPDRARADSFFYDHIDYTDLLDDNLSSIGIWRDQSSFKTMAKQAGWLAEFHQMPDSFYASHYRFDVLLTRVG